MIRVLTANAMQVTLKTLIVFHRLFNEGNARFVRSAATNIHIFGHLENYQDRTGNDPAKEKEFSYFIRKYSTYLNEKLAVYRQLGTEYDRNNVSELRSMAMSKLMEQLPKLQKQLDLLLKCTVRVAGWRGVA